MRKTILCLVALMCFSAVAQASEIMDWLDDHAAHVGKGEAVVADAAELLTLEEKQHEMYPRPSPDGRYLLDITWQGKDAWISRRFSENGDPANRVTFDERALDSIHWRGDDKVYYLSGRAGGLGLWEKISDGEGMQQRLMKLSGIITQPILLQDGSVIAVQLKHLNRKEKHQRKPDDFNNWTFPGYSSEIVHIDTNGNVHGLAEGVNPSLSPDGQWIVFAMPAGRSVHLFRMHTDGSALIQMTDARSVDVQPSWTNDGKAILFTSNRGNNNLRHPNKSGWDIWRIGADGRGLTQITFDKAKDGAAVTGKDGRIYFHSDRPIRAEDRAKHQVKSVRAHSFHIWVLKEESSLQTK